MTHVHFRLKNVCTVLLLSIMTIMGLFISLQNVRALVFFFPLSITTPYTSSLNNGSSVISFTSGSDATPLVGVCSIDNFVTYAECITGVTTLANIPGFGALPDGVFTLYLQDDDSSRNTQIEFREGIIKDTIPPVITPSAPTSGTHVNSTFSFVYSLSGNADSGTITFAQTGGSPDSASHVFVIARDDAANGTHTLSRTMLEAGFGNSLVDGAIYSITSVVTDMAGNQSAPITHTGITLDLTAPSAPARTHITSSNVISNLAKIGDTVTVTALVDAGTRVTGTIGGKVATSSSVNGSDATLTRLLDGTETEGVGLDFTIVSTDEAENYSETLTKTSIVDESSVQTDFTAPVLPTASPIAGTYTGTQSVTLSSVGSSSVLFTVDGTIPTCSTGIAYAGAISVSSSTTIKARGCDITGNASALATFSYTINISGGGSGGNVYTPPPSSPTASPIAGTYTGVQNVTLSSAGATSIRFTTDGTTPTCSVGTVYVGAIPVFSTKTIRARGCNVSGVASTLATFSYTINSSSGGSGSSVSTPSLPTANPVAGTFASTQNVTLSSTNATSIRFTTDGTTPTCSVGTVYTGAIVVSSTKTIKAKGCNVSGVASSLATFVYTINASSSNSSISPPSLPIASPVSGVYSSIQTVTLSSSGATSIRYTMDGTTPTCTIGSIYSGAISVSSTKTIRARGCNASGVMSPLAIYVYTINSSGGSSIYVAPIAVIIHDPSQYLKLLSDFGLISDPVNFEMYKSSVQSDASTYGVAITAEQVRVISNFITYGASTETIKLGSGERRAVIRDYFETVGRGDVVWDDIQRLTIGQKPVKRNLAKEQAQVAVALAHFTQMVGHPPNFKDTSEDLAWNTLMYRIRFPRDLVKEQQGIHKFESIFKRIPLTPFEWAIVRALGYVLKN